MDSLEIVVALVSLLSAVVGLVAAMAGRRQVVEVRRYAGEERASEAAPAVASGSPGKPAWWNQPGWLAFWLIFFWPVGLYGLVRSRFVAPALKHTAGYLMLGMVTLAIFAEL